MAVFAGFRPFLTKGSTVNGAQNMFFSDGLPGFHYLPSVTEARNFSNATTFGQRVYSLQDLKLNTSQNLGLELVTNGSFDSGITGWVATGGSTNSVVDGKLNVISPTSTNGSFHLMTGLKIGSTYRILATVNRNGATNVHVSVSASGSTEPRVYTYQSASDVGDVNIESYFVATATSHRIYVGRDCIGTSIYDNISVQEVSNASYALQASASLTPLLGRAPRSRRNNISDTVSTPSASNGTLTVGTSIIVENASIPMWEFNIGATALPTISGVSRARPDNASVRFNYMYSVFVKPDTNRYIYFSTNFGGVQNNVGSKFRYDTDTDTITAVYSGNVSDVYRGVQNLGNGIYRLFIRQRQNTNSGTKSVGVYCSSTSETTGANTYMTPTVAPNSTFLVGGWQSEIVDVTGIFPSNYQEVTSTVDVNETDVASYPFIRLDLSDDVLTTTNLVSAKNLLRFTEEFDSGAWVKSGVFITANAAIAPDGTQTADKIVATNGHVGGILIYQSPGTASNTHVYSFYAKAAEYYLVRAIEAGNFKYYATFNLNTGVVSASGGANFVSAQMLNVGDGWYRCAIFVSATTPGAPGAVAFPDNITPPTNVPVSYTGDGVSGAYFWGAQLEPGTTLTDYDYGGTKGTVLVAGKNGTAIETVYSPDGNFSLGPTTYTSGTPGMLRAVGDIVGYTLTGRSTTVAEQDQLLDLYKFRGAKGRFVDGLELFNFGSEWMGDFTVASSNSLFYMSGPTAEVVFDNTAGTLTVTQGNNVYYGYTGILLNGERQLTAGKIYKVTVRILSVTVAGWGSVTIHGSNSDASTLGSIPLTVTQQPQIRSFIFISSGSTQEQLRLYVGGPLGTAVYDYVSIKELRPEEEW